MILPVDLKDDDPRFVCVSCGHPKRLSQIGHTHKTGKQGGTTHECKACVERKVVCANTDKYITGSGKLLTKHTRESQHKLAEKNYKKGKLPKWMFS